MEDKKVEKLRRVLKQMDLVLLEHIKIFNTSPMPKNNYLLFENLGRGFNLKPPYKSSKRYKEVMINACTLKSYLTHFNNLPSDNFLNQFEDYDKTENEIAFETAKKFVDEKRSLKGFWLYGESGIGKSHLLVSTIYSYLTKQIRNRFSKLEPNQYFDVKIYGGENRNGEYSNFETPNLFYFNYMHDILCETHHKDSKSHIQNSFGSNNKDMIYFLDDVCEKNAQKILNHLINMYDKNFGTTAITSNYSIKDWLKIANSGQSQIGLEGRLKTFFKETKMIGNTKRKSTW